MSTQESRLAIWAPRILLAVVALIVMIAALPAYLRATAAPLHPQPENVPSVVRFAPSPQWSGAVDRARQVMRNALAGQNLPGLSVAVGVGGDLVWAEGFGWADIEHHVRMTPATRFRIGTASTPLTSAAAGVLLEQNRLQLDEEIQASVPEFPRKRLPVTLRQVMGHVAGVSTDSSDEQPLVRRRCERPVDALPHFAAHDLLFEPGTQYRYSKYGWILVSAAVESAANQPFLTFMRERVFQPLGMNDTYAETAKEENPEHIGEPEEDAPPLRLVQDLVFEPLGIGPKVEVPKNRATLYRPRFSAVPHYALHATPPRNLSCYAGSMAFLSTPSDLVRFVIGLNGGRLLQPATVQLLQTPQRLTSGKDTGYGLGWNLETVTLAGASTRSAGHDGEMSGGKVVSLMTFPDHGLVVAVMSNVSYADAPAIALRIADTFAAQ